MQCRSPLIFRKNFNIVNSWIVHPLTCLLSAGFTAILEYHCNIGVHCNIGGIKTLEAAFTQGQRRIQNPVRLLRWSVLHLLTIFAKGILSNISRSKGNQTTKCRQLIEYNTRNIFLEKSYTKGGGETSPNYFLKTQNWVYMWINSLKVYTVYLCQNISKAIFVLKMFKF